MKALIDILAKNGCKYSVGDTKFVKHPLIFDLVAAFNTHGSIMTKRARYDDAINEFMKAMRIYAVMGLVDNPTAEAEGLGGIYNNIGVAYEHKGQYEKAQEYYEKARDLYIKVSPRAFLCGRCLCCSPACTHCGRSSRVKTIKGLVRH